MKLLRSNTRPGMALWIGVRSRLDLRFGCFIYLFMEAILLRKRWIHIALLQFLHQLNEHGEDRSLQRIIKSVETLAGMHLCHLGKP